MISSFGIFFLWLSLIFSVLQILFSRKKNTNLNFKLIKFSVSGLLFCSLVSFLALAYAYVISDFSLVNVYQNSHTTKPLIYKISGVWGNHEGSMLLWILILTFFNYFIFRIYNSSNSSLVYKSLETQGLISAGFILFTILTSNPFEKMTTYVDNGLGFNPILQDPALAIHPPLLYIGYVGFSSVFSIGVATLRLKASEKISWYKYMRPFALTAWTFLTIGIAFGSIWAYYELGWGGWWFWDPVENASLVPWLLGTALLHSLITVEKKKSLQTWVLLLSLLTFILCVVGTFLVRSGILTSVHTFALDPSRGIFILLFIAALGCYSLILYGIKSKNYINSDYFSFFSKEGSILINNILKIVVCGSVFLGTIYPLLIEAFSNNKISVGEPYYNTAVVPIMIPAILVMGIGPLLSWGKEDKLKILKKIIPSLICTTIITLLFFLIYKSYSLIGVIGIILAAWIISNNSILFLSKVKRYSKSMIIAHFGIGLLILGVTGSSVWQEEKIIQMKINSEVKVKEYKIILKEINQIKAQNYLALQGNFAVYNDKRKLISSLKPENRFYPITKIFTTEAAIHTNLLRDLYIVLGEGNTNDGWVVRIYHNPLVIWIWIGAFTVFLGGIISINSNLNKLKHLQK